VVVSLQHRLPLFNSGADSLERLFLFWLLFLPSGAVGSLDAIWFPRQGFWRKRIHQSRWQYDLTLADSSPGPSSLSRHTICSWASAALLIQLVAIYLYSALEKLNADWWQGTAVATALQWDFIAKPLATTWLEFPGFLRCVTWTVLLLELLCPILIFTPYVFGWTRRLTAYFFITMHLAIAATLSIGTFSAVCLVGWLLFFPWPSEWRVSWTSLWRDPRDTGAPLPQQILASTRAVATAGECLVILLLTLTVWWNLSHASVLRPWIKFPVQLQPIVAQFGLDPNFPMFGQVPSHNYAWQHRVDFASGLSLNIRPDLPPPLNVPNRISSWAESHGVFLWRQLHVNLLYLESQQPDFVWQVRDQLRTLELEIWHEQRRQTSTPLAEPFESLHSELLLIDQVTQDEQSWSMTEL
jgi:hypothetical protein